MQKGFVPIPCLAVYKDAKLRTLVWFPESVYLSLTKPQPFITYC
jgi:hypothetical protein